MYGDFPFTIRDVAWLLNLHIRHKNTVSLDADCPFCGERKGKLNINLKKNVFKCNRCGESGGMLALYAKVYGVDNQTACREIKEKLGRNEQAPCHMAATTGTASNEPVVENAKTATDAVKDRTYTMLFSMLALAPTHRQELLKRGFTNGQIDANGYKSTPVFGFKSLVKKLADAGCTVKGVPGFYQDNDGEWSIYFNPKSAGYMIPVRNTNGMITGVQIRLDHPYDGRKYIWLSSINRHMGASSGSPIHLAGEPGAKTLFITEGPLKGDLSHALSGRTFGCVPGANQYANLAPFLKEMKALGTEFVYETYDMDKLLKTVCHGDYNEKCVHCPRYYEDWGHATIMCDKKMTKRNNIQRGCGRLAAICRELGLPGRTLTWDLDADGDWAGHVKGVDDYLAELVEGQKTYSKE
jgi:hypothetical protein